MGRASTSDPYRIRQAEPGEAASIAAIEDEAAQRYIDIGMADVAEEPTPPLAPINAAIAAGLACIVEHEDADGNTPVAFLHAKAVDGWLYIAEVGVLTAHSGHGLAARLLDHMQKLAQTRDLHGLSLITFRKVPWNGPYYARLGFAITTAADLGPGHAAIAHHERDALGYDPAERIMMIRRLA